MTEFPERTYADITVQGLTAGGKPAPLPPGTQLSWANSNTLAGDLFVNTDGMSGKLTYMDTGTGRVTISAAGLVSAALDYKCSSGTVTTLSATFGPVTPLP
jgi:hypothetical protein